MSDDSFLATPPADGSPWRRTQRLGPHAVAFVLGSETPRAGQAQLASVTRFWTELAAFDAAARLALHEDTLEDDAATSEYIDVHLDGLRFEVLTELFGDGDDIDPQGFVDALVLEQVALQPESRAAVFRYSLGPAITNYVLEVTTSLDRPARSIEMVQITRPDD